MAAVRWAFDRFVPVEPDAAFAWLSDYTEDDHDRPVYKRHAGARPDQHARREILSREGDVIRLRDHWGRRPFDATVTIDRAARALEVRSAHGYRARWWVEENPGGARVRVEGELAPGGFLSLMVPLMRARMLRQLQLDFNGHLADLLADLDPEVVPAVTT